MSHPKGEALLDALESGEVRAAVPGDGGWVVNGWVKEGLLAIFRESKVVPQRIEASGDAAAVFRDKELLRIQALGDREDVRLVPGGSAVRRGAHIGAGVVMMPPMYVNVGAFVGAGSMIDSHALVGSCAQVGERVHVSAGAQIGGVLEPIGARPVIVEDDAFIGGNTGLYDGVLVGTGAVIAAGVVLTAATPVFDLVHGNELSGSGVAPLEIPSGAVVVAGTRPARGDFATERGLSIACALIVKYRDDKTSAGVALEDALR